MTTPIQPSRNLAGMLVFTLALGRSSRARPADRSMPARRCPGRTRRRPSSSRRRSGPCWRRTAWSATARRSRRRACGSTRARPCSRGARPARRCGGQARARACWSRRSVTPADPDAPKGKLKRGGDRRADRLGQAGAPWPASRRVRSAAKLDSSPSSSPRSAITAKDRAFWSFRPIRNPQPPAVQDAAWPQSPIDRFILARLEANGLAPAPPADKRTLLRRVTFDLIGLPPTPEEIDAFLADDAPDAFARVVDRLLASPHYGERWGRHWLDVARYGEDQAHSFQPRLYPYGYRYRDWLIRAFNRDMPYDRFILEQIAGDLLDEPGPPRPPARPGLLRPGAGLLRRRQEARPVRRPHRHPDPRLPRPDRRLRPLPRPQVRPDPDDGLLRPGRRLRQHRVRRGPRRSQGAGRGLRQGPGRDPARRRRRSTASSRPRPTG